MYLHVDMPVHLHHQALVDALVHALPQVRLGLLVAGAGEQRPAQVVQVLDAGEFGDAGALHHAEQRDEEGRVLAQDLVRARGDAEEPGEQGAVLPPQHEHEVGSEDERDWLSVDLELLLPVS